MVATAPNITAAETMNVASISAGANETQQTVPNVTQTMAVASTSAGAATNETQRIVSSASKYSILFE